MMTQTLDRLTSFLTGWDRLELALRPTPIHFLPRLSADLGCRVYCKRDDLTGFGFGGNKIRKLEYILHGIDRTSRSCLVTYGSAQSNWCRMVAAAGAVLDIPVHLVLGKGPKTVMTANLRLNQLLGAEITFIESDDDSVLEKHMNEQSDDIAAQNCEPVKLPLGGSTPTGALGYIDAFREILNYSQETGVEFSDIVVASGSSGTQAGLVCGKVLSGWCGRILGVCVSRSAREQARKVAALASETLMNEIEKIDEEVIATDGSYVGAGYRKPTSECREAIELFARKEGLFLDEVYTGKAAAGLIDYARKGRFERDANILFVHTGGAVQLFE